MQKRKYDVFEEWLNICNEIKASTDDLRMLISDTEDIKSSLKANVIKDVCVNSVEVNSHVESIVFQYERDIKTLTDRVKRLSKIRSKLNNSINRLPEECHKIIDLRYKQKMNWEKISFEMTYDKRNCMILRDKANVIVTKRCKKYIKDWRVEQYGQVKIHRDSTKDSNKSLWSIEAIR